MSKEPVSKELFEAVTTPMAHKLDQISDKFDDFIAGHNAFEKRVVSLEKDVINNNHRISKIESKVEKVVWFVIVAVLGAVLKLVLEKGAH